MTRLGLVAAAALMLFQAFFILVPMQILGGAIGWPASLDFPASQILPLIHAKSGDMRVGYSLYLLWSVVFAISVTVIASHAARSKPLGGLGALAIGFGVTSSLARTLGILRWPTGSLVLADRYADTGLSTGDRLGIETLQSMLNAYGGGIGEILGVAIFGGLSVFVLGLLIVERGGLPAILGFIAIPVAMCVVSPAIALLGLVPPIDIVWTTTSSNLWFAACGLVFLARAVWPGTSDPVAA